MYSYGPPHMAVQKQDDHHEHTFSSYVRIRDVVLKTYLGRWTIGRSGERGSRISVLPARYDDDDQSENINTAEENEYNLIPAVNVSKVGGWSVSVIFVHVYICFYVWMCMLVCVSVYVREYKSVTFGYVYLSLCLYVYVCCYCCVCVCVCTCLCFAQSAGAVEYTDCTSAEG